MSQLHPEVGRTSLGAQVLGDLANNLLRIQSVVDRNVLPIVRMIRDRANEREFRSLRGTQSRGARRRTCARGGLSELGGELTQVGAEFGFFAPGSGFEVERLAHAVGLLM